MRDVMTLSDGTQLHWRPLWGDGLPLDPLDYFERRGIAPGRLEPLPDGYLTVMEAARIAGVTDSAVYNWVHQGEIEARKFGLSWGIPEEAL